jgi:hypothetical protein
MLIILLFPVKAFANEAFEEKVPIDVVLTVTDRPSDEDKDWPVVQTESYKTVNKDGLEVTYTLVVRQKPEIGLTQACSPLSDIEASLSGASCTQQSAQSFTRTVALGGVTSHVKHFATPYCSGTGCLTIYYKPYRVEAWWTRTATSRTVSNAKHGWGCDACLECPNNNTINQVYNDPSFTPGWQNSTTTYTYNYTSTQFKIMKFLATSFPRSIVTSDVYNNGVKQGSITNTVILPMD